MTNANDVWKKYVYSTWMTDDNVSIVFVKGYVKFFNDVA